MSTGHIGARIKQAVYSSYTKAQADDTFINQNKIPELKAGRKNFIINGVGPFVNQEGVTVGATNGDYICDVFRFVKGGTTGVFDLTNGNANNRIRIQTTTADAVLDANTLIAFDANIEGYDAKPLDLGTGQAKTVTISFNHIHSIAGTYCVALRNEGSPPDRHYVFEYEQSVGGAVEAHEETITLDTTGTWATDNSRGLTLRFVVAAGTDSHTSADSWQSGDKSATANQVNGIGSTSTFDIYNLQLEIGEVATDPEYIPYSEKLAQVQRYFEVVRSRMRFEAGIASEELVISSPFTVVKRASPTMSTTSQDFSANVSASFFTALSPAYCTHAVTSNISGGVDSVITGEADARL